MNIELTHIEKKKGLRFLCMGLSAQTKSPLNPTAEHREKNQISINYMTGNLLTSVGLIKFRSERILSRYLTS